MIALRTAAPLLALLIAAGCGLGAAKRPVSFIDLGSAPSSRNNGGAALIVATTEAGRATITSLRPGFAMPAGVVIIAAFEGQQRTGGFDIRIRSMERDGDKLIVSAIFVNPLDNAFVTQAASSPVQIVTISAADANGLRQAVLLDETGAERAHTNVD